MSKKKADSKRITNLPRSPLTDYTMPVRNMDEYYGKPGLESARVNDPLAEYEREQARDAIGELRDLKARKKRIELQRQIELEKNALGNVDVSGGGLNIKNLYNFSAQEIEAISKKTPEEQQGFYETLRTIQSMAAMSPVGGQGMNPMLQFMAMGGFNKQGQGLGMKDIIELQKMWQTINAGAGKGNQELTNTLMMKLITETVPNLQNQANQNLQMAYNAQIAHLQQNQSDPMKEIKYIKELGSELGWKPANTSNEVALKTLEMENLWRMKDFEYRLMEHRDRKNLGIMEQILTNAKDIVKNVSRESVRNMMKQPPQTQPADIPPPENPLQQDQFTGKAPMDANPLTPMVRTDPSNLKYYSCSGCGITLSAPAGTTRVLCPACGVVSNVTG